MYSKTYSATLKGIGANLITVEIDCSGGVPGFSLVGLVDKSINEAKERISVALRSSNYEIHPQKITVNLSPAQIRKEGVQLDLPIAAGLMLNFGYIQVEESFLENFCFLGELALTGELRPVTGLLALALEASKENIKYIVVPESNRDEAELVTLCTDKTIYQIKNLNDLKDLIETLASPEPNQEVLESFQVKLLNTDKLYSRITRSKLDLGDVVGQNFAKRGLEIAAAGRHHILMIGPPGCGKSMLASRFPYLLPELNIHEALEVTKIYSICGLLQDPIMIDSPIRAPHHSASSVSLVGGGAAAKPGEVSLAHRGVLFLDELTEFNKYTIEQLRQILENKQITINRIQQSLTYPADFVLIAACNPCPCGYLGDSERSCSCHPRAIANYIGKLSGPLLDRIDIHLELTRLSKEEMERLNQNKEPMSNEIRGRVKEAREFLDTNLPQMQLKESSQKLINDSISRLDLSARSYNKIIKVSKTIAGLDGKLEVEEEHLLEALQFRAVDWGRYK